MTKETRVKHRAEIVTKLADLYKTSRKTE